MSSESAAAAVGYAPRSGFQMYEYIQHFRCAIPEVLSLSTARRKVGIAESN